MTVVAIRKNLSFPPNAVLNFATRSGWTKVLMASLTLGCSFTRSYCAPAVVSGRIVDDSTGRLIPARIEIRSKAGKWFFPDSVGGSAVRYQKQNWINTNAVEQHTTLSAHPFKLELEPGVYNFTAEHGKEYRPVTQRVVLQGRTTNVLLRLHRWIDMSKRGWFSGDTHVHRDPAELPNVMLAEDVNVVFPMVYWTTVDSVPPNGQQKFKGSFPATPVSLDSTHLYYPRNTEYEIFTTAKRSHMLGALLVINHKTELNLPSVPVSAVGERAHQEGALLDLDKHNWPWSMAIVPLVQPDLYELANNHHWRIAYTITNWADQAPAWMNVGNGLATEEAWTLYGFRNYYALLDCGFRLRPTAGTANGVHPVPLGFGRVYVHVNGPFTYQKWVTALNEGRSFVTTGPMLQAQLDREDPGHHFLLKNGKARAVQIKGTVFSEQAITGIEIVVNGEVSHQVLPFGRINRDGAFESEFRREVTITGSSWIAIRCWEKHADGRLRFAHTAPTYFDLPGAPLRPRKEEADFLVQRVQNEIARSSELLPTEALAEYQKALTIYQEIQARAR